MYLAMTNTTMTARISVCDYCIYHCESVCLLVCLSLFPCDSLPEERCAAIQIQRLHRRQRCGWMYRCMNCCMDRHVERQRQTETDRNRQRDWQVDTDCQNTAASLSDI